MHFDAWVRDNRDDLIPTPPDPMEAEELLRVAEREIADAKSVRSHEGKLTHAYTACLSIARAALALAGYRVRSGAKGHHHLSLESLAFTLDLTGDSLREIHRYRQTRHQSIYDHADMVSASMADRALATAQELLDRFLEHHRN